MQIISKKSDARKIQLTIANNFISSINNNVMHVMHSESDRIEIIMNDEGYRGGGGGGGGAWEWSEGPPIAGIPFVDFPNSHLLKQ